MSASAAQSPDKRFPVSVERSVVFGRGKVGYSMPGTASWRDLQLDVFRPDIEPGASLPALVMAFGGAFHRGTRQDDRVMEGTSCNTPVAEYCHEFARRGYVCFSVDYRLVPEDPDPGRTPVVGNPEGVPRSRVDVVRKLLGLERASTDLLWRGIEAASDDFAQAFRFVQEHADRWHVDRARIAVGGFSAGARSAWNAAYGEGVPAAAVVSLSGTMHPADLARCLRSHPAPPPILLVHGEHDLDYVCAQNPQALALCRSAGIDCVESVVAGAGHFYLSSAPTLDDAGPSVEAVIAAFMASRVGVPAVGQPAFRGTS